MPTIDTAARARTWVDAYIAAAVADHNDEADLTPADPDYVYAPGEAQEVATEVLSLVGIAVAPGVAVRLTDGDDVGVADDGHRVNPGQVEAAVEQHRLATGEVFSTEALIGGLPWA